MVAPRTGAAAIAAGGGGRERLDGISKTDLVLGDRRLIDRVYGALLEARDAGYVAVVLPAMRVPDGVLHTLKDPPSGGPLVGIDAGLRTLGVDDNVLVTTTSVDVPGMGVFLLALLELALKEGVGRHIVRGGNPKSFNQCLMGVYRAVSLRCAIDEAMVVYGSARDVGVRRVLRALDVERVSVSTDACRDIDTPEDVAWWEIFLSN